MKPNKKNKSQNKIVQNIDLTANVPMKELFDRMENSDLRVFGIPIKISVLLCCAIIIVDSFYSFYTLKSNYSNQISIILSFAVLCGNAIAASIILFRGFRYINIAALIAVPPVILFLSCQIIISLFWNNDVFEFAMYATWVNVVIVFVYGSMGPRVSSILISSIITFWILVFIAHLHFYGIQSGRMEYDLFITIMFSTPVFALLMKLLAIIKMIHAHDSAALILAENNLAETTKMLHENDKLRNRLAIYNRASITDYISSTIIHEISSPINTAYLRINQALKMLSNKSVCPDVKTLLNSVESQINSSIEIMRRTKVFLGGSVESMEISDIGEVVRKSISFIEHDINYYSVNINVNEPIGGVWLNIDRVMLTQIFVNLLSNSLDALKDWEGAKKISIKLESGISDGQRIGVIEIADSGPGLQAEFADDFPDVFTTTKPSGTGLGLAICRMLAEHHSGSLTLSNGRHGGAVAKLILPGLPTSSARFDSKPRPG